ncbi:MAG: glycosyltransferase family 2 protein [Acidimicrobiales bacterium]
MTSTTIAFLVIGLLAGTILMWRLPVPENGSGDASLTSVIIPARNEAGNLPTLLSSLVAQTSRPLEVLVVDDGSSDATAEVARAGGASVITAEPPPTGWAGKPWACDTGVRAARGQRLLFLDADVRLAPDALARLSASASAPASLLSVQPFHDVVRSHEQLSAFPNAVALMASGAAAVHPSPRPGLAFGPCLLTTPEALRSAGGFEEVRAEAIEDIALARAYDRADLPVRCIGGGDAVRFRMYPDGVRSLVQGWGKNLSGGARRARPLPLAGAAIWVCAAVAASLEVIQADTPWAVAAYAAIAVQLGWILRRVGSFRWWVAALFPIPLLAFLGLFAWSLVQRVVRRQVTWRGRQIPV